MMEGTALFRLSALRKSYKIIVTKLQEEKACLNITSDRMSILILLVQLNAEDSRMISVIKKPYLQTSCT